MPLKFIRKENRHSHDLRNLPEGTEYVNPNEMKTVLKKGKKK